MATSQLIGKSEVILGETGVVVVSEPPETYLRQIAKLQRELLFLRQEVDRLSEYRHLALRDDLTGLYNRRCFSDRLTEEWSRARRYHTPLSVVMVDLDRFKMINDVAGHHVGDQVLHFVGGILAQTCREFDVVARIGGDEFAFLLPNTDRAGALVLMNRIHQMLYNASHGPELPDCLSVGFSHGIAQADFDQDTPAQLLARADANMYQNKRNRRAPVSSPMNGSPVSGVPRSVPIARLVVNAA